MEMSSHKARLFNLSREQKDPREDDRLRQQEQQRLGHRRIHEVHDQMRRYHELVVMQAVAGGGGVGTVSTSAKLKLNKKMLSSLCV